MPEILSQEDSREMANDVLRAAASAHLLLSNLNRAPVTVDCALVPVQNDAKAIAQGREERRQARNRHKAALELLVRLADLRRLDIPPSYAQAEGLVAMIETRLADRGEQ